MKCAITGQVLKIGSFLKKDGSTVNFVDVYLSDDGDTVRVYGYEGSNHSFGSDINLVVKVYNGQNNLYLKYVSEV